MQFQKCSKQLPGFCHVVVRLLRCSHKDVLSGYHGIAMKMLDVLCGFQGFAV